MKIRIKVRNIVTANEWTEDYDKVGIGENGNIQQAEDWAAQLIKRFNETCRPGESGRELLGVELLGASTDQRDRIWNRRSRLKMAKKFEELLDKMSPERRAIVTKESDLLSMAVAFTLISEKARFQADRTTDATAKISLLEIDEHCKTGLRIIARARQQ